MKPLNKSELVLGAIYGGVWAYFLGWWALLTVPACAVLWAVGGSGYGHAWRVVGCPVVLGAALWLSKHDLTPPAAAALSGVVLSLGYGIPTTHPVDPGSPIGRFWFQLLQMRENAASAATRATIGLLIALSFVALAKYSFSAWVLGVFLLTALFPVTDRFVKGSFEI